MNLKLFAVISGIAISGTMPLVAQEEEVPKLIQVVYEVFSLPEAEAAQSQRDSLTDRRSSWRSDRSPGKKPRLIM